MGQIALGFRSLLIKLAIFFVMAALLAWALGGTLWPRAEIVDSEPVAIGECEWFWRLTAGGRDHRQVWSMMIRCGDADPTALEGPEWAEVAGPVLAVDGLYFAGRTAGPWVLMRATGADEVETFELPDRLAVERQLARLGEGLGLQSAETIAQQRSAVLDPASPEAD
jgi:hypothetical protein